MSEYLYSYLDDLLRLQSEAADRHNHMGVLGAVRENFVVQILSERVDEIKIHTGEVTCKAGDLGQHDIIIRQIGTVNTELGGQIRLSATDCAGIIEIKSNAKGSEITAFDKKSALVKSDNPEAVCGMVCYKLNCRKDTILKRFGFFYDEDIEGFVIGNPTSPTYNNLDFILCLDEELETKGDNEYGKSFFLKKGQGYELFIQPPYMKYFLMEVNSLARVG